MRNHQPYTKGVCRYLLCSRYLDWLPVKLKVLFRAVWLGALDLDQFNEITHASYATVTKFSFDSEEHNLAGLFQWEVEIMERFLGHGRKVLIVGAGGGREAIALAQLGYQVTACDFACNLTEACKRNTKKVGVKVEVLETPPDQLPLGLRNSFDAIIAGRGFYHHIPGAKRRIALLQRCRQVLNPGGHLIILDFFVRNSRHTRGDRIVAKIANLIRWLRGSSERIEVGDWLSSAFFHSFTKSEVEAEAKMAGFCRIIQSETIGGLAVAVAMI